MIILIKFINHLFDNIGIDIEYKDKAFQIKYINIIAY